MSMVIRSVLVASSVAVLWMAGTVGAQDVVFDNRANVNILNASDPALTAGQGGASVSKLRFAATDSFWDGLPNPPGATNWISIDFKRLRNIKTVRLYQYSNSGATNGTLLTSTDGTTWSTPSATWTVSGQQLDIVLATAVDARYLKLIATDIQDGNGTDRWIVYEFRVFGDAGTLTDPDGVIDLISGTGWNGGVAMTLNGISITDTTTSQYVNDALNPLKRQVLYGIGPGDTVTYQFDRDFVISGLGVAPLSTDASSAFDVHVSTNGTDYALATSRTGVTEMATYFTFTPKRARYVRLTFGTWGGGYINDIQVFGLAPATNRAPTAYSQSQATTLGTPIPVTLSATDLDGDPLTWQVVTNPTLGNLSGALPNLTYRPVYGNVGTDSFSFVVSDGLLTSAVAQVLIVIYPAGSVAFDYRANVNILNASNVVLHAGQGDASVSKLRFSTFDNYWDAGANPPGGTNWISMDFQRTRNIKTIRASQYSGSGAASSTILTSADGAGWTAPAATWTTNGAQVEIVLTPAVDARFLKWIATDIQDVNGANRWIVYAMRVLGDAGLLVDPDGVLDLVSGTGWSGAMTLTRNGTVNNEGLTDAQFVDDALNPLQRQILWSIGTGDGFTLQFDRSFTFTALGLNLSTFEAAATFTVETSATGAGYTNVLTQSGGIASGPGYYPLKSSTGRYLRFTVTNTTQSDNRIMDLQVFGRSPLAPRPPGTRFYIR